MQNDPSSNPNLDNIPTGHEPRYLPAISNSQGDLIFDSAPPILSRRTGVKRWIVAGAVVLVLGAAVVIGVNAVPTLAASINGTPSSGTPGPNHRGPGGFGGFGGPGMRGPGGVLTITAVSKDSITATGPNSKTITIHTTSSTTYTRAGKTVTASAVVKGDTIAVRGQRNSDGSVNATSVQIVLPHYAGKVTAISGSTITIQSGRDGSITIHVASGATIQRTGQSATLSDIAVSDTIDATGTLNSDKSLNAEQIEIRVPHVGGLITAISGADITVKDPLGGTLVVHTTSSTTLTTITFSSGATAPAQTTITLASLKVGDTIAASGTRNSDGSINALTVRQLPAGANGGPYPGFGGHGGHGGPWGGKPGQSTSTPSTTN